jgi:hypothetical protein
MCDATYAALVNSVGEPGVVDVLVVLGYYSLLATLLEVFEVR